MEINHDQHDQEAEVQIISDIEKYGFHIGIIESDGYLPAFAYTIGLYETYEHPEIVCIGLEPELLGEVLNNAGYLIEKGYNLETGCAYADFLEDFDVEFIKVSKEYYSDYFGYARWYYEEWDFPVLQLVWPDDNGVLPWKEGFDPDLKFVQPLLDRNADFRFLEEHNLAVFTTRQVLDGKPILYVYHNEDGDWQFHSEADPQENEGVVASLKSLVELDSSLNHIYYLPYGWRAWRNTAQDKWHTEEWTEG